MFLLVVNSWFAFIACTIAVALDGCSTLHLALQTAPTNTANKWNSSRCLVNPCLITWEQSSFHPLRPSTSELWLINKFIEVQVHHIASRAAKWVTEWVNRALLWTLHCSSNVIVGDDRVLFSRAPGQSKPSLSTGSDHYCLNDSPSSTITAPIVSSLDAGPNLSLCQYKRDDDRWRLARVTRYSICVFTRFDP